MNYHSISVDQSRYSASIVANFLDTATVNTSTKFYKTTLKYDMTLIKDNESTSDEKVEKLNMEFNIQYRACIGSHIV